MCTCKNCGFVFDHSRFDFVLCPRCLCDPYLDVDALVSNAPWSVEWELQMIAASNGEYEDLCGFGI